MSAVPVVGARGADYRGPKLGPALSAEQDAQILRTEGAADELDDLVEWTGTHAVVED